MARALLRKARADILHRPVQTLLVFLVVAAASATVTQSVVSYDSSGQAYESRLAQTNGAHVLFFSPEGVSPSEYFDPVTEMAGITESAGPFPALWGRPYVSWQGKAVDISLYGYPIELPSVARPEITKGRWFSRNASNEIVLDHGLARERGIEVGDRVGVGQRGNDVQFEVVGLAVTASRASYPFWDATFGYLTPGALSRVEPDISQWHWIYGVRLADPESAHAFGQKARSLYPLDGKPGFDTWTRIRGEMQEVISIFTVWTGVLAVFAIGAAAMVVATVVGGYVLSQVRDIGLLKSVGMTPRSVALLLVAEQVVLGLPAAAAGLGIGLAASNLVQRTATPALGLTPPPVIDPFGLTFVVVGVVTVIAMATLFPAWQAARMPVVPAMRAERGGIRPVPRLAARMAAFFRLPPVFAEGLRGSLARPWRTGFTVVALTLAVIVAVFAAGMESTIRAISDDPRLTGGEPYNLVVSRGFAPDALGHDEVVQALESRDEVEGYYSQLWLRGLTQGRLTFLRGIDGAAYSSLAPRLVSGREFKEPGEAVVSRHTSQALGIGPGDHLSFIVDGHSSAWETHGAYLDLDGKPLNLEIVGVYLEGNVDEFHVRTPLSTLLRDLDPELAPRSYSVELSGGIDAEAAKIAFLQALGGRADVAALDEARENEETGNMIRPPVLAASGALLAIAVISLLITLLFAVQERFRDLGILKALGFTPGQITLSMGCTSLLLGALAALVGLPVGWLFTRFALNTIGEQTGVGSPFGDMPGTFELTLVAVVALLITIIGAAVPAAKAARLRVVEALRYE